MRYAAEFNAPFGTVESTGKLVATVQRVAAEAGRTDLVCSAEQAICVGVDDAAVARRAGVLDLTDLDQLELVASTVLPQV